MSKGIYKYTDLKTGEIVYIGKDSHIDKMNRHKDHLAPSAYNKQPFNRILQKNIYRYEYSVIWETENCTDLKLKKMEILFGKIYNPKFNYGKYGSGGSYKHSEDHNRKISESLMGHDVSEETRQKMSKSNMKDYARIIKEGFDNKGKQKYKIRYEAKKLKQSIHIHKLYKWFGKNYPNQYLYLEV